MSNNPFIDRSTYAKTAISALEVGMFVVELDRPWLETPFLIQGFIIKSRAEIKVLGKYCKYVYVDRPGRTWPVGKENVHKNQIKTAKKSQLGDEELLISQPKKKVEAGNNGNLIETIYQRKEYKPRTSMEEEHDNARQVYKSSKASVKGIFNQIRLANLVDTDVAKNIVVACVDSMLRNQEALLWVTRIKNMNDYTAEHCLNVAVLAIAFGRHLRLSEEELIKLGLCGLLHDVGKIIVPDEILDKPGKLTDAEFEVMKRHTIEGRDLLRRSKGIHQYVIDVAFNHHERIDGKGYPRELTATEISEFSRIIAIVDAFDAMTSDRCYDTARSNLDALKEIYKARGTQFDEALALEFITVVGPYPPGTIVELHNGCVGIVLSSPDKQRHLPVVEIVRDASGAEIEHKAYNLRHVESKRLDRGFLIRRVLKNGDRGIRLEDFPVRMMLKPAGSGQGAVDSLMGGD